jgi:hypothetical protein
MGIADRLHRLVPDLSASLARFPIPALISVLLAVYANLDVGDVVSSGDERDNQVYLGGAAAFIAAGAGHYFAQSRNLSRFAEIIMAAVAALAAGALAYWDQDLRSSHLFLFAGLLPLLMIAGFLRPDAKQGALWLFNLRLGLAVLLALVVGLIFAGGLSAIIESLRFLFEANIPWSYHEHVWVTAAALVAPIYGLSLMPARLDEEVTLADTRDTLIERGVSVLVNYVMVPIAIIYTLILHAYAVKILLSGALPEGQIGLMVTIFALGGTATWLIAWPWRETGTWMLRFFMRFWFWFTIVPVILLAMAIWERISTYGVTPERYGIVLVAIWLALVTIYLAIRRNRADMRVLLGSFAFLVLISSAGPWGANSLSIGSQFFRLAGYLESEKLLTSDGRIVDQPPALSEEGKREIQSILYELNTLGGLDKVRPFFASRKDDPFAPGITNWEAVNKTITMLKLNEWTPPPEQVSFNAGVPITQGISGQASLIGPVTAVERPAGTVPADIPAWIEGQTLYLRARGRQISVPVKPFLERLKLVAGTQSSQQQPTVYDIEGGINLIVTEAYGTLGDPPALHRANFWIILPQ